MMMTRMEDDADEDEKRGKLPLTAHSAVDSPPLLVVVGRRKCRPASAQQPLYMRSLPFEGIIASDPFQRKTYDIR